VVHALRFDEADHGPGPAAHFDEAVLDHIGGAYPLPEVPGQGEERQVWPLKTSQPCINYDAKARS
jgi:hypothetical protein